MQQTIIADIILRTEKMVEKGEMIIGMMEQPFFGVHDKMRTKPV